MTKEEFINAANEKYGDAYDCSRVTEQCIKHNINVPIICEKHGVFYTTPYMLLNGCFGCFECYKEKYWGNLKRGL